MRIKKAAGSILAAGIAIFLTVNAAVPLFAEENAESAAAPVIEGLEEAAGEGTEDLDADSLVRPATEGLEESAEVGTENPISDILGNSPGSAAENTAETGSEINVTVNTDESTAAGTEKLTSENRNTGSSAEPGAVGNSQENTDTVSAAGTENLTSEDNNTEKSDAGSEENSGAGNTEMPDAGSEENSGAGNTEKSDSENTEKPGSENSGSKDNSASGSTDKSASESASGSTEKPAAGSTKEKSAEADADPAAKEEKSGESAGESREAAAEKAKKAFLEFIEGTRKLTYHTDNISSNYIVLSNKLSDGGKYTLAEMTAVFQNAADSANEMHPETRESMKPVTVSYAFLEEGEAPLMAVHFSGELQWSENLNMYYILQYDSKKDEVNAVFGRDVWSRGFLSINKAGVVTFYGSGSAFDQVYTYFRITADGRTEHIYSALYDCRKAALSDLSDWSQQIYLVSYIIGRDPGKDMNDDSGEEAVDEWDTADYYTLHGYHGGDSTFTIEPPGMFNSESPIYALYSEDGTRITDSSVVATAILKKMEERKISMEMLFAAEAQWTDCK